MLDTKDPPHLHANKLPVNPYESLKANKKLFERGPDNASMKQLAHFVQLAASGKFQHYDYGAAENMKRYGQPEPPSFDLTAIDQVPVAMFVGKQDDLADVLDTRWERDQIKSVVYYKEFDNYDHSSFTMGNDEVREYLADLI